MVANKNLHKLKNKSSFKDKIVIGKHSIHTRGSGNTHKDAYVHPVTQKYDGVNFHGRKGQLNLTNGLKKILKEANIVNMNNRSTSSVVRGNKLK